MARKNVTKVFKAWIAGQAANGPKGRNGISVWTDGQTLYSYKMPIAVKMAPRSAFVSKDSPSVTTSIHRNNVLYLLSLEGWASAKVSADEVKRASKIEKAA
jgi:hypothetical protein